MRTSERVFIVVKEYDDSLAKRQPWYTVRYFKEELSSRGYQVFIVGSEAEIPQSFRGRVLKVLSLKDLILGRRKRKAVYDLTYLCTMPLYSAREIWRCGPLVIYRNFRDLWRILLASLIPYFWVSSVLSSASSSVFFSDVRFERFKKIKNSYLVIPFTLGNWPSFAEKAEDYRPELRAAYLGPPFETRGIDTVAKIFRLAAPMDLKLIIRLERSELRKRFSPFQKLLSEATIVSGMLSRQELFEELRDRNTAILPFRVVMSECPIVVLEAIELGLHVITTKECGVSSLSGFPGSIMRSGADAAGAITNLRDLPRRSGPSSKEFFAAIEEYNNRFWKKKF